MPKAKILDTNVLINYWHRFPKQEERTPASVRAHAEHLIDSPVLIEFLAGALGRKELDLYEAYLSPFEVLDRGDIPRQDWTEAERLAKWIKIKGRMRRLGDCLIQAIASRLNCDVITADPDFRPRILPG